MTTLTQEETQAIRKRLEAARDKALKDLDAVVHTEKQGIWNDYYRGLELIGLDKNGKQKRTM